jgi:hypothetical protein
MFFPYDPWKSVLYPEFVRWVPPPSNPPEMTNMEKLYVALDHRVNPPKCHCDKVAVLQEPSKDKLFTLFYRCAQCDNVSIASMILFSEVICVIHIITLELQHYHFQRGFPSRDFEEYIYGPKSHCLLRRRL